MSSSEKRNSTVLESLPVLEKLPPGGGGGGVGSSSNQVIVETRRESVVSNYSVFSDTSVISDSILLSSFAREGTTWLGGITIMANVCIGMGLLNYPRAIAVAGGLLPSSFLFIIFVMLIALSLGMTAYCCRYYGSVNYQDMVTTSCGPVAGYLCQACLLLETIGNCIVKLVVFADQMDRVMSIIRGSNDFDQYWYMSRQFTMPLVTTITILPFCLMRDFQIFKYTSVVGIIGAFYITFGVALVRFITGVEMPTHVTPVTAPYDAFSILPLLVYSFHGNIEAPLVFCCLQYNRIFYFMRMVYGYLLVATVIYAGGAIFGYLTFGRFADEDLLLSYPPGDWVVNIATFLVIIKLLTSFPVVFFVMRSVVEEILGRHSIPGMPKKLEDPEVRRVLQTILLFTLCVTLAALIPNMSNAIHLIGGISCNLAFTFPGLCFLKIHYNSDKSLLKHRIRRIVGAIFVVIGAFLTGTNTCYAVYGFITPHSE